MSQRPPRVVPSEESSLAPNIIVCARGRHRIICDICDSGGTLKVPWRGGQPIDLCGKCEARYNTDAPFAAWADAVIARNLGRSA